MSDIGLDSENVRHNPVINIAVNAIAMLAFTFTALTSHERIGYGLGAVVLATVGYAAVRREPGGYVVPQLLVLAGLLVDLDAQGHSDLSALILVLSGVVLMSMVIGETTFRRLATGRPQEVANLPGARFSLRPLVSPGILVGVTTPLIALVGVTAAVNAPTSPVAALTAADVAATGVVALHMLAARLRARRSAGVIRAALERYQPEFALYFSAPANTEYHVMMWLPYLERAGRNFMIILREHDSLPMIAKAAKCPVVVCTSVSAVDNVVVPSLSATFYVNNGMKNAHMVRFSHLTHVQLLHGDSDKASSYNPVTAMFDKVYVAGPAAIDRYAANGVHIPAAKFVTVGRPQVEDVAIATGPIREITDKTVLYATTWSGLYTDANYCSLAAGTTIVAALLDRGATVIFRPHPYTDRTPETRALASQIEDLLAADAAKTGRAHLYGSAAQRDLTLFECFNRADAMISDVSGVASDWLYSEKPFALTNMIAEEADFESAFPLARAAYRLDAGDLEPDDLSAVLDDLLDRDPRAAERRTTKAYFLGDVDARPYADVFVRAVRSELDSAGRTGGAAAPITSIAESTIAMATDSAGAGHP
jgi:hypothetical protein